MRDVPDAPYIRQMERDGELTQPVIHGWKWWKEDENNEHRSDDCYGRFGIGKTDAE